MQPWLTCDDLPIPASQVLGLHRHVCSLEGKLLFPYGMHPSVGGAIPS